MAEAALHEHADPLAADVYRAVLWHLREAGIPYLVGGTYALEHHAGLVRSTKDLDLFVRRADWSRISDALAGAGIEDVLPAPRLASVFGLDSGYLYWMEIEAVQAFGSVYRAPTDDTSSPELLATGVPPIAAFAFDATAVYWTNQDAGTVMKLAK